MQDPTAKSQKDHRPRVFLCHSSGDKAVVRELHSRLKNDGIDPWLDEEELFPGQNWEAEIAAAVRLCDAVAVCLSRKGVDREGYIHKEITIALDIAERKPEGTVFIIPVRLEQEVEVPDRLRKWQWANLFEHDGYQRLVFILRNPHYRRWEGFSLDAPTWPPSGVGKGKD